MNKSRDTAVSNRSRQPNPASGNSWLSYFLRNNVVTVILLMVLAVPLITGTSIVSARGKVLAFELLSVVLMSVVAVRIRWSGALGRIKQNITAGPNLPLVLLVGMAAVSCACSPRSFERFSVTETLRIAFCAVLYFVVVYCLRGSRQLMMLINGLLLVTAVVSLVGLAQMTVENAAVASTFGTHDMLGSFLMLMLPIALALGLAEQVESRQQIAAQVVALLTAACLLMARTRSAWIGEAVALGMLSFLAYRYTASKTNGSLLRQKHLIVGPLMILIGAVALFVTLSGTGQQITARAQTLGHVGSDTAVFGRVAMWKGAMSMIKANPFVGLGVGSFPVRQEAYTGYGRDTATVLSMGANQNNVAHNYYLQSAAEMGFLGLGLYLAALAMFFVYGIRGLRRGNDPLRKTILIGCMAACAGQLVDAVTSPAYNFASVSMFQWLLVGIGMYAAGLNKSEAAAREAAEADAAPVASVPAAKRAFRYAGIGLAALFAMAQLVPTTTAALADDYSSSGISGDTALGVAVVGGAIIAGSMSHAGAGSGGGLIIGGSPRGEGELGMPMNATLASGEHYTIQAVWNGKPISDASYSLTGDTNLVTVSSENGEFIITRTHEAGTGEVTLHVTFTDDTGHIHHVDKVIHLI
jgi:O-antigen ligase